MNNPSIASPAAPVKDGAARQNRLKECCGCGTEARFLGLYCAACRPAPPVAPTDFGCIPINRAFVAELDLRRWLAEGLCPTCGALPEDDTLILCVECTEKGWR